eukprot:UN24623
MSRAVMLFEVFKLAIRRLTFVKRVLTVVVEFLYPPYCESDLLDLSPGVGEFAGAKKFLRQVEVRGEVKVNYHGKLSFEPVSLLF